MSKRTKCFANLVTKTFAHKTFTEDDINKLAHENDGCSISTLLKYGVIQYSSPRYNIIRSWTPYEFAEFINNQLCNQDLNNYPNKFVWYEESQKFVEREQLTPYYTITM